MDTKKNTTLKKKQNKKINAVLHSLFYDVSRLSAQQQQQQQHNNIGDENNEKIYKWS